MHNLSKLSKPRILLVEDHAIAQKIAVMILNSLNCEVDISETGDQAIKLFSSVKYDLVFVDLGLPDKDGYTITKDLRKVEDEKALSQTVIIGLSVHSSNLVKANAINAGMNDYIIKPLTIKIAKNILTKYIDNLTYNN